MHTEEVYLPKAKAVAPRYSTILLIPAMVSCRPGRQPHGAGAVTIYTTRCVKNISMAKYNILTLLN